MRNWIAAAVVVVLVIAGVWYFKPHGEAGITNYPSKGSDVIAFGDSLVVGYGATADHDFVTLLSKKIGEQIINLGVNGDTTDSAVERLKVFDRYHPKVVLVLLGGNDALQHVATADTFKNLHTIVTDLQKRGAIVLVLGVRGGLIDTIYPGEFQKLIDETHAAYVPDVLSGLFGNRSYMADGIHPNDAGNAIIADKIYPVLKPLLK